jgi:hypothetical protein
MSEDKWRRLGIWIFAIFGVLIVYSLAYPHLVNWITGPRR